MSSILNFISNCCYSFESMIFVTKSSSFNLFLFYMSSIVNLLLICFCLMTFLSTLLIHYQIVLLCDILFELVMVLSTSSISLCVFFYLDLRNFLLTCFNIFCSMIFFSHQIDSFVLMSSFISYV